MNSLRFPGCGGLPPMPPGRSWQSGYCEPGDPAGIQEWRSGYSVGAARARECGFDGIVPAPIAANAPAGQETTQSEWITSSSGWEGDDSRSEPPMVARLTPTPSSAEQETPPVDPQPDPTLAIQHSVTPSPPGAVTPAPVTGPAPTVTGPAPTAMHNPELAPMSPLPMPHIHSPRSTPGPSTPRDAGDTVKSPPKATHKALDIPDGLFQSPATLPLPPVSVPSGGERDAVGNSRDSADPVPSAAKALEIKPMAYFQGQPSNPLAPLPVAGTTTVPSDERPDAPRSEPAHVDRAQPAVHLTEEAGPIGKAPAMAVDPAGYASPLKAQRTVAQIPAVALPEKEASESDGSVKSNSQPASPPPSESPSAHEIAPTELTVRPEVWRLFRTTTTAAPAQLPPTAATVPPQRLPSLPVRGSDKMR